MTTNATPGDQLLLASGLLDQKCGTAVISKCGAYRYSLTRRVSQEDIIDGHCVFIMLNPSTADGTLDDPTIRRCIAFARKWGFGWLDVVNLFAYRATDPRTLQQPEIDPVGIENDRYILDYVQLASVVVAAWGNHGSLHGRSEKVLSMLKTCDIPVWHLGLNKPQPGLFQGQPRHPLYVKSSTILERL